MLGSLLSRASISPPLSFTSERPSRVGFTEGDGVRRKPGNCWDFYSLFSAIKIPRQHLCNMCAAEGQEADNSGRPSGGEEVVFK